MLQKANMLEFYTKQKISLSYPYLWKANNYQTCPKGHLFYLAGHLAFANHFLETADIGDGQV